MFVQIHMLQSMPPGNLNRDETGQPKKCLFGGVTRGRISSQCLKRRIRRSPEFKAAFGGALADRTTYLPRMVAEALKEGKLGVPDEELELLMAAIAARFKKEKRGGESDESGEEESAPGAEPEATGGNGQTGQLVFFPQPFAQRIAELLSGFRTREPEAYRLLRTGEANETSEQQTERKNKAKDLKDRRKAVNAAKKRAATPDEEAQAKAQDAALREEEKRFKDECANGAKALQAKIDSLTGDIATASKSLTVDIGLFGRMTTSDLVVNVEATCQVAHAISTHEAIIESDYFTAMDDRKAQYVQSQTDKAGAAFLGSGETETFFDAAVYYKYLNVDLDALCRHLPTLGDDGAAKVAATLLKAAALANPTGKQNSFASHSVPEMILVEVSRTRRPISYANAFLEPVEGPDYLAQSASALKAYVESVAPAFAPADLTRLVLAVGRAKIEIGGAKPVSTLDALAESVAAAVTGKEQVTA